MCAAYLRSDAPVRCSAKMLMCFCEWKLFCVCLRLGNFHVFKGVMVEKRLQCQRSPGGTRVVNTWDPERLAAWKLFSEKGSMFCHSWGLLHFELWSGNIQAFCQYHVLKGSKLYLQYLKSLILLSFSSFHLPGKLLLLSCNMFNSALLHSSAFNSPLTMQGCNSWNL